LPASENSFARLGTAAHLCEAVPLAFPEAIDMYGVEGVRFTSLQFDRSRRERSHQTVTSKVSAGASKRLYWARPRTVAFSNKAIDMYGVEGVRLTSLGENLIITRPA